MAKKKEVSVEQKLRALYDLQLIDSRIDEIRNVRGELPLEVEDLEDEVAGLNTRVVNLEADVTNLEADINNKKLAIEESTSLMKKYDEQQKKVRNNREFDSITKEIEYQDLEIQLAEKRINEYKAKIAQKMEVVNATKEKLAKQQQHLKHKKAELDAILKETEKDEKLLSEKSDEFSKSLDDHLFSAYSRIRTKVKNGLAVVAIERGASGGSYFTIPPQVQLEIANRKKITIDEHSGRILVDAALAEEEKAKIDKLFA
ncbi:zinc ribbon domain-containing protein [Polaribacter sp.]|uniref:zinc ribbon domain-containing protein n=1 Tax=Polaribacter sp. TaxID=1920175 RepID=UPI003EFA54A3